MKGKKPAHLDPGGKKDSKKQIWLTLTQVVNKKTHLDPGGEELVDGQRDLRRDDDPLVILPVQEHLELGVLDLPVPFPLLLRLVVDDHIRFVDNLLLDDLLDDVLEGDEADRLVEGVALALGVDLLDQGHVTLVPGLELVKHVRQDGVLYSTLSCCGADAF
jgi:hypothetical protein